MPENGRGCSDSDGGVLNGPELGKCFNPESWGGAGF